MPGPKMGARPHDFDESVVRKAPTFIKWQTLPEGTKLRYACRDFTKGKPEDEERLMRRIMIARRNNIRDHEMLKRARKGSGIKKDPEEEEANDAKKRKLDGRKLMSDDDVRQEMDIAAVEATRSYKTWLRLIDGTEFIYNQRYVKGKEGHDFLLKKNIWRRMRYRRQNKQMVEKMKDTSVIPGNPGNLIIDCGRGMVESSYSPLMSHAADMLLRRDAHHHNPVSVLSDDHVDTANQAAAAAAASTALVNKAVVEAAVAAAASYVNTQKHIKNCIANPLAVATARLGGIDATQIMAEVPSLMSFLKTREDLASAHAHVAQMQNQLQSQVQNEDLASVHAQVAQMQSQLQSQVQQGLNPVEKAEEDHMASVHAQVAQMQNQLHSHAQQGLNPCKREDDDCMGTISI